MSSRQSGSTASRSVVASSTLATPGRAIHRGLAHFEQARRDKDGVRRICERFKREERRYTWHRNILAGTSKVMGDMLEQRAGFTSMREGTKADWDIIVERYQPFARALPDRILSHLELLGGDDGGFAVDRLHHSLLTATLAHKGGEDEEYVVCALLHDIGDTLGTWNHPDVAAAIVKPFVSEANHWMVEKHGIFQGYYFFEHVGMDPNMREQFRGHPQFERTARFCEMYDGPAFDPALECAPLEFFEPMLRRVFAFPKHSIYRDTCQP